MKFRRRVCTVSAEKYAHVVLQYILHVDVLEQVIIFFPVCELYITKSRPNNFKNGLLGQL